MALGCAHASYSGPTLTAALLVVMEVLLLLSHPQVPDIPRLLQRLQLMQAKPDAACFKQLSEGLAALFQLRQQVQGLAPGALLQQRMPWEVADPPAQVHGHGVGGQRFHSSTCTSCPDISAFFMFLCLSTRCFCCCGCCCLQDIPFAGSWLGQEPMAAGGATPWDGLVICRQLLTSITDDLLGCE